MKREHGFWLFDFLGGEGGGRGTCTRWGRLLAAVVQLGVLVSESHRACPYPSTSLYGVNYAAHGPTP